MRLPKLIIACAVTLGCHTLLIFNGMNPSSPLVGHAQTPCPVRGSCNLEPGLVGRSDLLFFEDFEQTDWQSHFTGIGFPTNVSTPTAPIYAGGRAVEVRVPTGAHDGASLNFDFTNAGLTDPEEIYFRYYIRFNDSWQRTGDGEIGKLPGFDAAYGSNAGHGCNPSDGTNGWSSRMVNYDRGAVHQVGFYVYHADMTGTCGEHMAWPPMLERNRWYSIEARVRVNTISGTRGNNDGILQGWIDDVLVFSRTNLRFRDVPNLRIERIWGNVFVGGTWVADRNMAVHFDNMVIARNRIRAATAGSGIAPVAPSNLRIIVS